MRVATMSVEGTQHWGRVEDDSLIEAGALAPNLREYLVSSGDVETLERHDGKRLELATGKFVAPVTNPSKIWCVGLNFDDYRRELGIDFLEAPNIFLKAPSALVGHDAEVGVPSGYGTVFHEWELTAVVGSTLSGATPEEAEEAIFGYTILDDLTFHEIELVNRDHQQWAKNVDGFAPCGPWIVTSDELDPTDGLPMRRRLNGELEAESSSSQMRHTMPELLSFLSTFSTLEPGDLVTGGTPPAGPCVAGDEIEGEIEGIGTLRAHLVDRSVDPQWQEVIAGWTES